MNKRISFLVASGFALLLGLGALVSIIMMTGLKATVVRAQASQASTLEVRAAVRSLRADYLESADAVNRVMLGSSQADTADAKREADANAERHLVSAEVATRRPDLKALLGRIREHDASVTNRLERKLLALAGADAGKAKRIYFARYLPARALNMTMVGQALQLASEEVSATARLTEDQAAQTLLLAWIALGLFALVGTVSGLLLSRAVRGVATRFEHEHVRMLAEVAAARDAAVEGSRIKSEFLANMSHEIRTPMNVIIGYIDIILESDINPTHHEYLERVRGAAVDLLDIINDVLDISKVEAGKLTMERVPFGLRAVLDDVLRALVLRAEQKGLTLSVDVEPSVVDRVTGDPTRLRQVALNLVSNAIKFTERGEVVVRVRQESSAGGAAHLHFSVRDTGIGIPADKQDLIFLAFTQADGSMSRRFGGTGLGLTIAARLVDLMGGRIWVESQVGKGSTFYFTVQTDLDRSGLAA